jgi:hypothetical protein
MQWVLGALSLEVKRQGSEADHSPPSSAEVKNAWLYTSTPTPLPLPITYLTCVQHQMSHFSSYGSKEILSISLSLFTTLVTLSPEQGNS